MRRESFCSGKNNSSKRFASATIGKSSFNSLSDSKAADNCPFPPSISTRSGNVFFSFNWRLYRLNTTSLIDSKSSTLSTLMLYFL